MNRRILALAAAAVVGALCALPARADTGDIRSLPFSITPIKVNRASYGEPSMAISKKDHVFFCGPQGIPGGQIDLTRTADWKTFTTVHIFDRLGGGDCHEAIGADGAVYTANLQAVASAIRKSTDDGVTFNDMATEDPVEQDRQWLAPDPTDANTIYFGYHDFSANLIVMSKSTDGGATFLQHSIASSPAMLTDDARATVPGPVRIDPTDHNRIYIEWTNSTVDACEADPVACATNRQLGQGQQVQLVVARSDDGGVTWTQHIAATAPPGARLGQIIPWMSIDLAGNLYVALAGHLPDGSGGQQNGMYFASSPDHGETWSAPHKVNTGAGAVVFPTVAAGAAGIADFSWAESTKTSSDDTAGDWTVHFAQSRDALSATPTYTEITGPFVHHGDICTNGILCTAGGDRSLLDFMDLQLDSFGYAHMVIAQNPTGALTLLWWRQDAGPSAYSEPCTTAGDPSCVTVRPGPQP